MFACRHIVVVKEKTMTSHFDNNSVKEAKLQYNYHNCWFDLVCVGPCQFRGSESSDATFKSYSFYVEFNPVDGGCGPVIHSDCCKVDVGSENIVIVVPKGSESQLLEMF